MILRHQASAKHPQNGGSVSLLLILAAIAVLSYFALKTGGGAKSETGDALNCEPRIAALVRDTGGVGAAAQAAYDGLPGECRKMVPDPAALAPLPASSPDT